MSAANLQTINGKLYVVLSDQQYEVLKGYESFSGCYWFITEYSYKQDSDLGDGQIIKDDQICFGLVQLHDEEMGYFSEGEIKSLGAMRVWEIKQHDLPHAGRRS